MDDNIISLSAYSANRISTESKSINSAKLASNKYVNPRLPGYNNGDGGGTMKDDRYVTHAELELNTEKVLHHMDNKFNDVDRHFAEVDKRFVEVDNRLDLLGQKIDQIPTTIENSILRERELQRQQHTETTRYFFGTIIIGLISIAVSIIGLMR